MMDDGIIYCTSINTEGYISVLFIERPYLKAEQWQLTSWYGEEGMRKATLRLFARLHKLAKTPSEVAPMVGVREALWHLDLKNELVLVRILWDKYTVFVARALQPFVDSKGRYSAGFARWLCAKN